MSPDEKNEIALLVEEAKRCLQVYPSADQIIVVKTAKSNVGSFANNISDEKYEDEKKFVQKLIKEDDGIIEYIYCVWNDLNVDFPSMNFRKLLLEANAQNMQAKMYLGDRIMEICQSMP